LKGKRQNIDINELFRQRLGKAEASPDVRVGIKLMRKVALRNFMHFSPGSFNIFYLGGIIAAGITAALLLTSPGTPDGLPAGGSSTREDTGNSDIGEEVIIYTEPEHNESDDIIGEISGKVAESPVNESVAVGKSEGVDHKSEIDGGDEITTLVIDSLSLNTLSELKPADMNKLQEASPKREVLFEALPASGCAPLKIDFNIKSVEYDSCRWSFGDGNYSCDSDPAYLYDTEGEYEVRLQLFSKQELTATSAASIRVYPGPKAEFEFTPEDPAIPMDEIWFRNYSSNAVSFDWSFGDGICSELFEPRHRYLEPGDYDVSLIATSEHGCSDTLLVENAFSGSGYFIRFPNAFIPNQQGPTGGYYSSKSDEAAQVFHPVMSGVVDYQLNIYSKRGILIFESDDINIGWDGYLNGQLNEPGVYIWDVKGRYRNGEPFTMRGDVTLLMGNSNY
jgi:PKD repeat protein